MSGRPLLAALCACIEQLGGDDVLFDRVANNEKIESIMSSFINPATGEPFARTTFYYWLNAGGEPRKTRYTEARKIAAHFLVDAAGEDLEGNVLTPADAAIRQRRAEHKKWLAEKWNREVYGEQKQAAVEINIGLEHLEALRRGGTLAAVPEETPALDAGPDYEVLEDEAEPVIDFTVLEGGKGSATLSESTRDAGVPDQPSAVDEFEVAS